MWLQLWGTFAATLTIAALCLWAVSDAPLYDVAMLWGIVLAGMTAGVSLGRSMARKRRDDEE